MVWLVKAETQQARPAAASSTAVNGTGERESERMDFVSGETRALEDTAGQDGDDSSDGEPLFDDDYTYMNDGHTS
jgi:hypothetical protein